MSAIEEINFKITGQTKGDDCWEKKRLLKAKIELICAEFDLELEEV
jgi:hypothetical protein